MEQNKGMNKNAETVIVYGGLAYGREHLVLSRRGRMLLVCPAGPELHWAFWVNQCDTEPIFEI